MPPAWLKGSAVPCSGSIVSVWHGATRGLFSHRTPTAFSLRTTRTLSPTPNQIIYTLESIYAYVQLCLFYLKIGSAILLKIQNILLKYEQIIEHEKNRYAAVWREVRKLESEKEESKLRAEETQDLKSMLAHQEVEWKSDIQSLKYVILCSDNVLPCQC